MLQKITSLKTDELVRGSFILFIMIGFYNGFNYLFQMSMAKMLGPAEYGILATLMAIIYVFSIPSEAISIIIARYTSKFNATSNLGKTHDLLVRSLKKSLVFASIFFIGFLIISIFLTSFLRIDYLLLSLTGTFIFMVFTFPVVRGVLQGRKKFTGLGLNMIVESAAKVVIAIALVALGFGVYGAMGAVILSSIIAFIASFYLIKEVFRSSKEHENFKGVYIENIPVLIAMISLVLMYTLDTILARAYFSPEVAGIYAFVALVGKFIIFVSSAIGKAMFPISTENFEKGEQTKGLLKKAVLLVIGISLFFLLVYGFFPEGVIFILSLGSSAYLSAAPALIYIGLASSCMAIATILILYQLSLNKMRKSSILLLGFVVLEVILLSYNSGDILRFSISLFISSFLMLVYVLLTFRK